MPAYQLNRVLRMYTPLVAATRRKFHHARLPRLLRLTSDKANQKPRLSYYVSIFSMLLVLSLLLHSLQAPPMQLVTEGPALIHDQTKMVTIAQPHTSRLLYIMHQPAEADNTLTRSLLSLLCVSYVRFRQPLRQDIYKLLLRLLLLPNKFRSTFVDRHLSPV